MLRLFFNYNQYIQKQTFSYVIFNKILKLQPQWLCYTFINAEIFKLQFLPQKIRFFSYISKAYQYYVKYQ